MQPQGVLLDSLLASHNQRLEVLLNSAGICPTILTEM